MPKSSKKKKEKAADFSKAKLKLGKGKQVANNATDTSFKTKSIILPNQSITASKPEGEPRTSRNLNLENLLSRVKHYSPQSRRDAIAGLRELLEAHPELMGSSLGVLLQATVRAMIDEDSSVRKALLQLFSWIIPLVSKENLVPHVAFVLLHITSAMSHIFPEIRVDAVRFLDILLITVPEVFSASEQRVLAGYMTILNLRSKAGEEAPALTSAGASLSPASRLVVLRSLLRYVKIMADSTTWLDLDTYVASGKIPTWYLERSFRTEEGYSAFLSLLGSNRRHYRLVGWKAEMPPISEDDSASNNCLNGYPPIDVMPRSWSLGEVDQLLEKDDCDSNLALIVDLSQSLHHILIVTFLDIAPSAFMPPHSSRQEVGSIETQIELLCTVGLLTSSIYGTILRRGSTDAVKATASENVKNIMSRMAPYFPFGDGVPIRPDAQVEQHFQDLNLIYCDLISLLFTQHQWSSRSALKRKQDHFDVPRQLHRVREWVSKAIRGQIVSSTQPLGQQLSSTAYLALLPTIWSLLNTRTDTTTEEDGEKSSGVATDDTWLAILEHFHRAGAMSSGKKLSLQFIGSLVLLQADQQYCGAFKMETKDIQDWLITLPRILWEINTRDPLCSELIVLVLLRALDRPSLISISTAQVLATQLVPFFYINHPTKGPIFGPWRQFTFDSAVHRLSLQLVKSLQRECGDNALHDLRSAVSSALGAEASGSN
ncbi:hypothetical protein FRC03_012359 [Tulasnella sp. 419]|nr:hypothetical protein FRC02_006977 [Tulasnella sp. 418]KAG8966169.1 hypothetical protein FRC03_012359 [Tulasnella sp. 419]